MCELHLKLDLRIGAAFVPASQIWSLLALRANFMFDNALRMAVSAFFPWHASDEVHSLLQ